MTLVGAARAGDLAEVKRLLAAGAEVDPRDNSTRPLGEHKRSLRSCLIAVGRSIWCGRSRSENNCGSTPLREQLWSLQKQNGARPNGRAYDA